MCILEYKNACVYVAAMYDIWYLYYLQSGMRIEFIEKIHKQVYFERADTQHYMFLCLCSVAAVIPSRLLSLHPQVDQLLKLTHNKLSETRTHKKKGYPRLFRHLPTCRGSTTRATQIMMTTSNWEGHMRGVTSPKPTVEKVTMQK